MTINKSQNILKATIISGMVFMGVIFVYFLSDISKRLSVQNDINIKNALQLNELKVNVLRIQQHLLNVSVTKSISGFNQAEESKKEADEIINNLKKSSPSLLPKLLKLKDELDVSYDLSVKMAKIYNSSGFEVGNLMMMKVNPIVRSTSINIDEMLKSETNRMVEVNRIIKDQTLNLINITIIGCLFFIGIILFLTHLTSKSIKTTSVVIENLNEISKYDFTKFKNLTDENEVSNINNGLSELLNEFKSIINTVKKSSDDTLAVSKQVSFSSKNVKNNLVEIQSSSIKIEENSKNISSNVSTLDNRMIDSNINLKNAEIALKNVSSSFMSIINGINTISASEAEIAENMIHLEKNSSQIKEVLNIISDIADQTNLLALNAAIEAARAGTHGRGFAVVADEVRKLAERTQKSLTDINSSISVVVQGIGDSSDKIDKNSKELFSLVKESSIVEKEIKDIDSTMKNLTSDNERTLSDFAEVNSSVQNLIINIAKINSDNELNLTSTQEIENTSNSLLILTNNLNIVISKFKV